MKELEKIAPELSKIKKDQPFKAPENYFDDFSARLHYKIEAEKNILPQPKNQIIRYLKPALGLAASFIFIAILVYWPMRSFLPQYLADTNTQIESENENETYISYLERMDESSFFSFLQESFSDENTEEEDFNDEELLNYLSANVSDYEIYMQTENN